MDIDKVIQGIDYYELVCSMSDELRDGIEAAIYVYHQENEGDESDSVESIVGSL